MLMTLPNNIKKVLTYHIVTNITVAIVYSGLSDVNDLDGDS